jgi:hypothetical protein
MMLALYKYNLTNIYFFCDICQLLLVMLQHFPPGMDVLFTQTSMIIISFTFLKSFNNPVLQIKIHV